MTTKPTSPVTSTRAGEEMIWEDVDTVAAEACVHALVGHGVPCDVIELLISGRGRGRNRREVAPGALTTAIKAVILSYRQSPDGQVANSIQASSSASEKVCDHPSTEKSGDSTCYVERSKVREILISQPDENLEITEEILREVDELTIFTSADLLPIDVLHEARFLIDRLKEYDPEDSDHVRDYMGHVEPSLVRLDRITAPLIANPANSLRSLPEPSLLGRETVREEPWLVWSNQHKAWWRANSQGYTNDCRQAGLYSRQEAFDIARTARDGWTAKRPPDELAIPLCAVPEDLRPASLSPLKD